MSFRSLAAMRRPSAACFISPCSCMKRSIYHTLSSPDSSLFTVQERGFRLLGCLSTPDANWSLQCELKKPQLSRIPLKAFKNTLFSVHQSYSSVATARPLFVKKIVPVSLKEDSMGNSEPVLLKLLPAVCLLITAGWEAPPAVCISRAGPKVNTQLGRASLS